MVGSNTTGSKVIVSSGSAIDRASRKLPAPLSAVLSTTIIFFRRTCVCVMTFCDVEVKVGGDASAEAGVQADRNRTSANNTEKFFIFILLLSML